MVSLHFPGITKATYVVGEDHQDREAAEDIRALGKHTSVSDLQLLITSRSSWDNTTYVMHVLDTLPHLRHLQVLGLTISMCFLPHQHVLLFPWAMPVLPLEYGRVLKP